MKLALMGTGPFALPSFRAVLDDGQHQVVVLVTKPESPSRGRQPQQQNPVRQLMAKYELPVLDPLDINTPEDRQLLAAYQPDLLLVCDYGRILAKETLAAAPLGGINLHGSLLPKYRGAAPVNWAIWCGEQETGVSVIHMTPRLDAGPCLLQQPLAILPDETAPQLEARLAECGVDLVRQSLRMLEHWDGRQPLGTPQDPSQTTKAPRLAKQDGQVDFQRSAQQIANQVRALKPWPGTYTFWQRSAGDQPLRLILEQVSVGDAASDDADPGRVVRCEGGQIWVATGKGLLVLHQIQPAGKRILEAAEFLRGYPLQRGDRLG